MGSSRRSAALCTRGGASQPLDRALGPKRPDGRRLALPCSIPRPDARAWRGKIVGPQSALRDGPTVAHQYIALERDLCRKHGMSEGTFYAWKAKYSGMTVSEAKRLKALEDENAKLKKLLAEQMLDMAAMKELLSKKW